MENELLKQILQGINELKIDVHDLKTDVSILKTDVSNLKTDGIEIKTDISGLKEGQTSLQQNQVSLQQGLASLQQSQESLQQGQTRLEQDFAAFRLEYRKDMQRIDVRLKGTNERLDSFKFDTDLLIEKEAKLEFKVNNLEKNLK
ncbi:hypothetical protein LC085_13710 [Bacillus tianshenii]|uniref:hypothetical protein n=1 Tax=Sutcliffiella tianshenii TaxID=1463404 RepID=UPI001CD76A30|nr:hypothetical protein [Bacillus tianshenii]MCA1320973.1 hypothetical protein [Bacillus tianshenii]